MIDKHNVASQFTIDLPVPPIKQRIAPPEWQSIDDLPELHGEVALDFETKDPGIAAKTGSSWAHPGEGFVTGFSIATRHSGDFYCSVAHAGGNGDADKYWRWLAAQAAKPDVTFVYANAIYDLGWLRRHDIAPSQPPIDIQGMAALLDEDRRSYSLDSLLRDFLGRQKATDDLRRRAREYGITNPYLHMDRLPAWDVAPYATQDARDTLDIFDLLRPQIAEQQLERVLEVERECLLIGRDLRWNGVRVNLDTVAQVQTDFSQKRDDAITQIRDLTGIPVSPWDNVAIAKALKAEQPDFPFEMTSKGIPSIRAAAIDAMNTPVSKAVRDMREYDKAITTTLSGITKFVGRDGRIHSEFHPLRKTSDEDGEEGATQGTISGRWSSSKPNMQNIPRRKPYIGTPIRRCFEPEEGELWGKLDYSSQEPRLATHFASLTRGWRDAKGRWHVPTEDWHNREPLPGATDLVEKYNASPTMSFHKEVGKAMGLETVGAAYDSLKINNLALIYGMSGRTFCLNNGYATKWITRWDGKEIEIAGEEGQAFIDRHTQAVPWGKPLARIAQEAAELRGYTKTVLGRRIRYRKRYVDGRLMDVNKALNHSVQGSAADQMKLAMVIMRRASITPLVVVHDDGNVSVPRGAAGEIFMRKVAEIMADAIKLRVPSLAETKVGATWGDVS